MIDNLISIGPFILLKFILYHIGGHLLVDLSRMKNKWPGYK